MLRERNVRELLIKKGNFGLFLVGNVVENSKIVMKIFQEFVAGPDVNFKNDVILLLYKEIYRKMPKIKIGDFLRF